MCFDILAQQKLNVFFAIACDNRVLSGERRISHEGIKARGTLTVFSCIENLWELQRPVEGAAVAEGVGDNLEGFRGIAGLDGAMGGGDGRRMRR